MVWSLCSLFVPHYSEYRKTSSDNMELHVCVTYKLQVINFLPKSYVSRPLLEKDIFSLILVNDHEIFAFLVVAHGRFDCILTQFQVHLPRSQSTLMALCLQQAPQVRCMAGIQWRKIFFLLKIPMLWTQMIWTLRSKDTVCIKEKSAKHHFWHGE